LLNSALLQAAVTDRVAPPTSQRAPISLILVGLILFANYVACFSRLGALGLVGNDEPRYASIARTMSESGDWITPRLNGSPWFEKPVLYYWAAAVTFRVLGESDYAARLPSGIAVLVATLAIAWAAKRFYSVAEAVVVLLLMPTCVAIVGFARGAGPDMLFAASLTIAVVLSAVIVSEVQNNWRFCSAFGAALGVAALAKGPAALILAAGGIALWALLSKEWRRAFRAAHPVAIASFLVVAVPWYALCASRNPDFIRTFFLLHNIQRFTTPVFHHVRPFWYFVPIVIAGLIPWIALIFPAADGAKIALKNHTWSSRPGLYFGCWAAFTIVFFSISRSKLPGYVLPAIPPLILLFANAAVQLIRTRDRALARWTGVAIGLTWLTGGIAVAIWHSRLPANSPFREIGVRGWVIEIFATSFVISALALFRRITAALLANAVAFALLLEAVNLALLPQVDPFVSARSAARQAISAGYAPPSIQSYDLREPWKFGLEHYLNHSLAEFSPSTRAQSGDASTLFVFTSQSGCAHLVAKNFSCMAIQTVSPEAWLAEVR
jgi:4-amino-4-deoxy-L-arabinose transferase-like glycosyltransferase